MAACAKLCATFCKFTITIVGCCHVAGCCWRALRDISMQTSLALVLRIQARLRSRKGLHDCFLSLHLRTMQRCVPITIERHWSLKVLLRANEMNECGCVEVQMRHMRLQSITCPSHSRPTSQLLTLQRQQHDLRYWRYAEMCSHHCRKTSVMTIHADALRFKCGTCRCKALLVLSIHVRLRSYQRFNDIDMPTE